MATTANILKEFLVAVGFQIDEKGAKKLKEGVEKVEKAAIKLATAATATAVTVSAAVVKMSEGFEDLYYASQRIGDTVDRIKGLNYAISQVGGTAKGSMQALEGVAEFMRSSPGGERFIQGLGVATRDTNGQLRGMTDIFADLGDRFRAMPYAQAKVRAQLLGIDPITLQAMIRGTDEFRTRYADMARKIGVDQQRAAKASRDFMRSIRDLQAQLELVAAKILIAFQGPAGKTLERFGAIALRVLTAAGTLVIRLADAFAALDDATGGWATGLAVAVGFLTPLLALLGPTVVAILALGTGLVLLIDDYQTWREGGKSLINWGQWSTEIDQALAGFKDLGDAVAGLWNTLRPFMDWLGHVLVPFFGGALKTNIAVLTTVLHGVADVITVITDLLQGRWMKAWQDAGKAVDNAGKGIKDVLGKGATWISNTARAALGQNVEGPGQPATAAAQARAVATAARDRIAPIAAGAGSLGAQALAYFRSQGWTKEQAAGIIANVAKESSFNAKAVGDGGKAFGIAQWHPDRQANFKKLFGKDIRESTFAEQLAFIQHELTAGTEKAAGAVLRATKTARDAGAAVSRHYERPAAANMEARLRGDMAERWFARADLTSGAPQANQVTIDQKTDIHVHGGNARETGQQVAMQQDRVNGNLIRHTKSAVR